MLILSTIIFFPSLEYWFANFPIVVVFPVPFTPTTKIIDGFLLSKSNPPVDAKTSF